jgi:hypothetical protein
MIQVVYKIEISSAIYTGIAEPINFRYGGWAGMAAGERTKEWPL